MKFETDNRYLDKINEIGDKVYEFYNISGRKDVIMVYEMEKDVIYSYLYEEFSSSLNEKSRKILRMQYREAIKSGKIVLFIRDQEKKKFKSYVI